MWNLRLILILTFPERVVYHKAIQTYTTVCGGIPD